jgi:hypothetical protein
MLLKGMVLASLFVAMGGAGAAQMSLSEIEVRLVRSQGGGGCIDYCTDNYTVTIRGDGTVEFQGGPLQGFHTRSVAPDDVVSLVNEFLRARFLNAFDNYEACCSLLVRKGNMLELYGYGSSAEEPSKKLTLRIGTRTKTVILRNDFPDALGRLPGLVDRIGGPEAWR